MAENFDRLASQTRLWHDTWYDSTLPYWFLDRTFLNTSILATSTCHRFGNGRFWAGKAWAAATAPAPTSGTTPRPWPGSSRNSSATRASGSTSAWPSTPKPASSASAAEFDRGLAVDGQAGTLLRAYREHQMAADDTFLKRNWPQIKKAFDPLLRLDANRDGILEGAQHNTLDQPWFGKIAWLSSLYLAALRAGEEMAREMGDEAFARQCREIVEKGRRSIDARLFNGEYYIHQADPAHAKIGRLARRLRDRPGLRPELGLAGRPGPDPARGQREDRLALAVAVQLHARRRAVPRGQQAGPLVRHARRRRAADVHVAQGDGKPGDGQGFDFYFNECMNGFEYQVAGHMIWEGMVQEGLAVTRMVHDRYHATRRNPWNEVECGDHYARGMASYGVFLAACGYEYHGPKGHLGFAPRLTPDNFRCAFTTATAWGSYAQRFEGARLESRLAVRWGHLHLRNLALGLDPGFRPAKVTARAGDKDVAATLVVKDGKAEIAFAEESRPAPATPWK